MGNSGGGGGGFFFWRKKVVPARKPPLKTANDVAQSPAAKSIISEAVKKHLPGTPSRFQKILIDINVDPAPTEKEPDPLRIDLADSELKNYFKLSYDNITSVSSDGFSLMREYMPKLYDKHSLERGKRVSQRERETKHLSDECYAYGELEYEIFATIYIKVSTVFGMRPSSPIFYDLGCGAGLLVYAAVFIGNFTKAVGIDNVSSLLERGEKRMRRWEQMKEPFPAGIRDCNIEWIEDNFILSNFWTEGNFILLHWTAFSKEQRAAISKLLSRCDEGTQVISFTTPVDGNDFEILVKDSCETSWGRADFFFQEKITPPSLKS